MKPIILILFASVFLLSGCAESYQLFKTAPLGDIKLSKDSAYVFENDTVQIAYNFWGPYGQMNVSITNKLNIPLYIDWKKCIFFRGTKGVPFYSENIITNTQIKSHSIYWGYGYSTSKGNSTSTSVRQERITYIPQHAMVNNNQFLIAPYLGIKIDSPIQRMDSDLFYHTLVPVSVKNYSQINTPYSFRIILTYSTNESFQKEFYVDNSFYVNQVADLPITIFWGIRDTRYKTPIGYFIHVPQGHHARRKAIVDDGLIETLNN